MRVIQLLPDLPPPEALHDYATLLGDALAEGGLLCDRLSLSPDAGRRRPPLESLTDGAASLVLHYVNYAYDRLGCPSGLVAAVDHWKREGRGRRLTTVFHEVYATSPPWRSAFWLSPWQRHLAARLARVSDGIVTSLDLYASYLRRGRPAAAVHVLPVFSSVGEPVEVQPVAMRARTLVVFGATATRQHAYDHRRAGLEATCRALAIEEILDVGPPLSRPVDVLADRPVRRMGTLDRTELARVLSRALAGAVVHAAPFLPKSTVFAAYCAYGLVPVSLEPLPHETEGPRSWTPTDGSRPPAGALEALVQANQRWYSRHSLSVHADLHRRLLSGDARMERPS
jgi:hypothetical protein